MLADDISGKDVGFNGAKDIFTPRLDEMAKDGVVFETCWANAICQPTRAMLLSGKYAYQTGWFDNGDPLPGQPRKENLGIESGTFAQVAQKQGYMTLAAGKWQLSPKEGEIATTSSHGFDRYCLWAHSDVESIRELRNKGNVRRRYWNPLIVIDDRVQIPRPTVFGPLEFLDCVEKFIAEQKAANKPFLIYWAMTMAHYENKDYVPIPILSGDGRIVGQEQTGSYKRNIEFIDYMIGRYFEALKKNRVRRKTMTFFTTDNGAPKYGKGRNAPNERGVRVPCVWHCPRRFLKGISTRRPFSLVDIYSTVSYLVGAPPPRDRPHSLSFANFLLGQATTTPREWLFSIKGAGRVIRDSDYILDGNDDLWNCSKSSDESFCEKITDLVGVNSLITSIYRKLRRTVRIMDRTGYVNASNPLL